MIEAAMQEYLSPPREGEDVDVGDPLISETAQMLGAAVGALAAGGVAAWQVLKRRKRDTHPPAPQPVTSLDDARTALAETERAKLQLELTQRVYDLAVEEQVSRVDERRRDEQLARIAELLDQLYVRDQRQARSADERTRQLEDQLARMERTLHDIGRNLRRSRSVPPGDDR